MRLPRVFVLVTFLALITGMGALPLRAKESPTSILNRLPNQIAGITHGEIHTYDDPRFGASIPFNANGLTITLYVYDLGVSLISNGVEDMAIKKTFDGAKGDVQKSPSYANVRLLREGPAKFHGNVATLHAEFELEMNTQNRGVMAVFSEIHVFGAWNQIFKLRITRERDLKTALDPKVADFMNEILRAIEFLPPARQ